MRHSILPGLLSILALACGGAGGGAGDSGDDSAAPDADVLDAAVDAVVDAVVDAPPPAEEPDTDIGDEAHERWVFMQSHLHTTGFHACANSPLDPGPLPEGTCFTGEGVTGFLEEALANQASDMLITDHNNIGAWFDPAFVPLASDDMTRYATPLRGTEWSSKNGHMTLLFPRELVSSNDMAIAMGLIFEGGNDTDVSGDSDYQDIIDAVHAAGGVVMINHPELLIHAFPEGTLGADGVEVGVPPNPLNDVEGGITGLQASKEARDWWQRRLVEGDRLTGTAGADHHHGMGDIPGLEAPTFGLAVNLLRVDPTRPNTDDVAEALANPTRTIDQRSDLVVDAITRGHVMIVEDPDAARVYVGVDLDGDGRFHDARAGDCVPSDFDGSAIRVRIRITNPSSATLSTHYNLVFWDHTDSADEADFVEVDYDDGFEERADLYTVDPDDAFAIELELPYDPSVAGFLRVVLERDVIGPVNDTEVVTNPIYYGAWAEECGPSAPLF